MWTIHEVLAIEKTEDSPFPIKMTAFLLQGQGLTLHLCPPSTWHRLDTEQVLPEFLQMIE